MPYREDLIASLKASGHWDKFTASERNLISTFDENFVREFLNQVDAIEHRNLQRASDLSQPESEASKKIATEVIKEVASDLSQLFDGRLIAHDEAKQRISLSALACPLAEFLIEAEKLGYSQSDVILELHRITPEVALTILQFRKNELSSED